MRSKHKTNPVPIYHGKRWIRDGLPKKHEQWSLGKQQCSTGQVVTGSELERVLTNAVSHVSWKHPKKTVFFVADPHADAEAFVASLVASGGVRKVGAANADIELTTEGKNGVFVIGGDCLDKGPSNLNLLKAIRSLKDTGAKVKLLAGNHDVRLLMGIRAMGLKRDTKTEHLFVRMGPKVIPLLREVYDEYPDCRKPSNKLTEVECRKKLYPSNNWFREFPKRASETINQQGIERELTRMRKKVRVFEKSCLDAGLTLRDVYSVAEKCRELFLRPKGEFSWFFHEMQLLHREGSFLFVHAGVCDDVAELLRTRGVNYLNRTFRKQIKHKLFDFYYGPLANAMRTKYRKVDRSLSDTGVSNIYKAGIHAVVHGHRNRTCGQRMMLRQNMLHIEGDITMDRNSRKKEGLDGYGAGATIVRTDGVVVGVSTDYRFAKVFEPNVYL